MQNCTVEYVGLLCVVGTQTYGIHTVDAMEAECPKVPLLCPVYAASDSIPILRRGWAAGRMGTNGIVRTGGSRHVQTLSGGRSLIRKRDMCPHLFALNQKSRELPFLLLMG